MHLLVAECRTRICDSTECDLLYFLVIIVDQWESKIQVHHGKFTSLVFQCHYLVLHVFQHSLLYALQLLLCRIYWLANKQMHLILILIYSFHSLQTDLYDRLYTSMPSISYFCVTFTSRLGMLCSFPLDCPKSYITVSIEGWKGCGTMMCGAVLIVLHSFMSYDNVVLLIVILVDMQSLAWRSSCHQHLMQILIDFLSVAYSLHSNIYISPHVWKSISSNMPISDC